MASLPRYGWVVLCVGLGVLAVGQAAAQGPETQVTAALSSLDAWLGDSERAQAWRTFLCSEALEQELARGPSADRKVLAQALGRYTSGKPGLELRRFVAVRQALERWLDALPPWSVADLSQLARDAKSQFRPMTDADVTRAREALAAAVAGLERLLNQGTEEDRQGWKTYLEWDQMQAQLQAGAKADWKLLQTLAAKYIEEREGLELPQFTAVRDNLRRYSDAVLFATNTKAEEFHQQYATELADRLQAYVAKPNAGDAIAIGRLVGWLDRFQQADDLVAAVRRHYWKPNFYVQLSETMLNTGISMDVDEEVSVREVIMGTTIRGQAHMEGRVTLDFVPRDEHAAIDLFLQGTTYSNNVGRNGPVKIYSTGTTWVSGRKRVMVSDTGLSSWRAQASCRTSSSINRIQADCDLVEKIAWNRARKTKSQVESIASQRAAGKAARMMDDQARDLLAQANDAFNQKFRYPLIRRGGFPQLLELRSTDNVLQVTALEAGPDQLAAPDDPPSLATAHDVAVRIHESLVGNLTQAAFGGLTLTDERMADIVEKLTGNVPDELKIGQENDPWSITFAAERPVDVTFQDSVATVCIRGKRFTRGDQEVRDNIEISTAYRLEKTPTGSRMTRVSDVNIEYVGKKQLTVAQVTMKTFLKKKFENLFKPQTESDGVELPGRWGKPGKLRLDQLICDDGWLALGWFHPNTPAQDATAQVAVLERP